MFIRKLLCYLAMDAREGRRQTVATGVILVVLTLERLAYYALATNFFLFLNKVGSFLLLVPEPC